MKVTFGRDAGRRMRRFATRLLLVGVTTAACAGGTEPPEPFGFAYQVVLQPEPPALTGTTVSVRLSYGGCRDNHEFVLRSESQASTMSVWLQKATPDQPCDMLVTERRTFPMPQPSQATATVVLLAPDGTSYQLRP